MAMPAMRPTSQSSLVVLTNQFERAIWEELRRYAIALHNLGWIEATGGDFQFYIDGVTHSVAKLMEAIDRERVSIGRMLGIGVISAKKWLKLAYDSKGENLHEAIQNQEGYRDIRAPSTINHRYINEDVPMSLVPMASLGNVWGIRVRSMTSIIRQACIVRNPNFWALGRSVERLGISNIRSEQLLSIVTEGNVDAIRMSKESDFYSFAH